MMIETDILYAYIKKEDWLKPTANKVMLKIARGELGAVYASRESLHEIYYVSREEGVSTDELITRFAALTAIENLIFLETTYEIDLLALALIRQYGINSIFDAYYAATALNQIPDHTIISTDTVFNIIPGIKRIDPREV
ncbi:PIN domain-containing protein [Candidatus Bathyarchaeota archaeon]|nr:PIN domain-containing protein [Candidatus Bathyarchaeota archaeon]MBS7612673.1 PIN domain-containing protein [Candidatus Bathyarchaeota archaeon]MBS7617846.1 PIN domain-containing protein [Candidatus Bathyarchaeota archaeon]